MFLCVREGVSAVAVGSVILGVSCVKRPHFLDVSTFPWPGNVETNGFESG